MLYSLGIALFLHANYSLWHKTVTPAKAIYCDQPSSSAAGISRCFLPPKPNFTGSYS
jgi:hypothetical protein